VKKEKTKGIKIRSVLLIALTAVIGISIAALALKSRGGGDSDNTGGNNTGANTGGNNNSGGGTGTGGGSGWKAVKDSTFGSTNINAIAYGGSKFVAVGPRGKVAYSSL